MTHTFDIEPLVANLAEDSPCGSNLEYDPDFQALELAVGDADWPEVKRQALIVAQRTRDLRVALYLTRAELHTSGFVGCATGLAFVAELLTVQWPDLFPELEDLDEGLPPTRLNLLASLGVADSALMEESMCSEVRTAPFVQMQGLGKFSWRDVLVAQGELTADEEAPSVDLGSIKGALNDGDKEVLQETFNAIQASLSDLTRITDVFTEQLGAAWAPDFQPLKTLLTDILNFIAPHADLKPQLGEISSTTDVAENASSTGMSAGGAIATRNDAIKVLEKVCEYFEIHEPSSPVPLLLRRANRLVNMDFIDLVRDLSPEAVAQIEQIAGIHE